MHSTRAATTNDESFAIETEARESQVRRRAYHSAAAFEMARKSLPALDRGSARQSTPREWKFDHSYKTDLRKVSRSTMT
jgi:hypothetical protein